MINLIAIFHAYRFTHFTESNQFFKRISPNELSTLEKIKTIFLGIEIPKPHSDLALPNGYEIKKIPSNVELDIWIKKIENEKGIVLLRLTMLYNYQNGILSF